MISKELTVDGSEKGAEHSLETPFHKRPGILPPRDLGGFPHPFLELILLTSVVNQGLGQASERFG